MVSSRSEITNPIPSELPYDGHQYPPSSDIMAEGNTVWGYSGPSSLSMSVDVHNLVSSVPEEALSLPGPEANRDHVFANGGERMDHSAKTTTKSSHGAQSGPEEEEESYEGFGYGHGDADVDGDSPGGSSSAPSPTGQNPPRDARSPPGSIGRHSWLRTSLRRTPPGSGKKRLGSNALASQLYRSSSFNSSGRGSTCDTADDIYSDASLEDDVLVLNHTVQMIQEQVHALADTQSVGEERYARAKQENATLQARIIMLEEASKDAEARAEERLQAEQRRHRDWAGRLERERQLQLENYAIRLQAAEVESTGLRDEAARLREQLERVKAERLEMVESVDEARREARDARDAERKALGRASEAQSLLQAAREEISTRVEDQQKVEELVHQVAQLRARNKSLEESRDELQAAAAALQAGRELLMLNPCSRDIDCNKEASLAAELRAGMNQDQTDGQSHADRGEFCTASEMRQALKEQQEVNSQLRAYIDGILLNIVENYPQLLEVKHSQ